MRICILIPCYNHAETVAQVALAARAHGAVLVIDDGSTVPLPSLPGCEVYRLERNRGKGAALTAGFERAIAQGYTHAITMDADGQHNAEDLPSMLEAARLHPEALVVGVRDFAAAGAPAGRRCTNAVSSFWFRVETGVALPDTQCGFRCYPLELVRQLRVRSGRYAFELESMVRAAWCGTPIVAVPITCTYLPHQLRHSHFRPIRDLAHITIMNIGLVLQSWLVPLNLRVAWSTGQAKTWRMVVREFFSEHAEDPLRLSLAVGLGLFWGVAPIWGYQMVAAATFAHWLRLNKAIAILASNISIPPFMPLILFASLALGHWMFEGEWIQLHAAQMTRDRVLDYVWQWAVGSVVFGAVMAMVGALACYGVARWLRKS